MEEKLDYSLLAWEEGEPAQTLLAPEQPMAAVVSSHHGQVFFLTEDGRVYLSTLKQESSGLSGKLQELALPCQCVVGVACSATHALFVTDRGRVLKSELLTPEKVEELLVNKPKLSCPHGVWEDGERLVIREIASNVKHIILVSDSGQVWLVNEEKSQHLELLLTFCDKTPLSIVCGKDFSVALVQEQFEPGNNASVLNLSKNPPSQVKPANGAALNDTSSMFASSCAQCREQCTQSSSLSKLETQNNNVMNLSNADSSKEDSLAQVCWSKADSLVRQSALFLNSDAAKQFLTRQLSWVTGSTELDENAGPVSAQLADSVTDGIAPSHHCSEDREEDSACANSDDSALSFERLSLQNYRSPDGDPSPSESSPKSVRLYRGALNECQKKRLWKRHTTSSLSLDSAVPLISPSRENLPAKYKLSEQIDQIVLFGNCLLNTSVWTWGHGHLGQLGHSDCVSRDQPSCITSLSGIGVCKLAVGTSHCLALTIDGRVWAWGSNNKGQIRTGQEKHGFISTPFEVVLPVKTTIRDIAAGGEHSLLLTTDGQVFFLGYSMATQKSTLLRLNLPVQSPNRLQTELSSSKSSDAGHMNGGMSKRRIWACGSLSCCSTCSFQSCTKSSQWAIELLMSEQLFLRCCFNVRQTITRHLLTSGAGDNPPSASYKARANLFAQYDRLIASVAYHIHSLTNVTAAKDQVSIVRCVDETIAIYGDYFKALADALVVNAFNLSRSESAALDKVWPGVVDLFQKSNSATASGSTSKSSPHTVRASANPFHMVMMEPLCRLKMYAASLKKMAVADAPNLKCHLEMANEWSSIAQYYERAALTLDSQCHGADTTRVFWDSCPAKLAGNHFIPADGAEAYSARLTFSRATALTEIDARIVVNLLLFFYRRL